MVTDAQQVRSSIGASITKGYFKEANAALDRIVSQNIALKEVLVVVEELEKVQRKLALQWDPSAEELNACLKLRKLTAKYRKAELERLATPEVCNHGVPLASCCWWCEKNRKEKNDAG